MTGAERQRRSRRMQGEACEAMIDALRRIEMVRTGKEAREIAARVLDDISTGPMEGKQR